MSKPTCGPGVELADLAIGILSKLKVPDRREISDWAEDNLTLPESKRSRTFRADTAPWLIPVLDSIKENTFTSYLKATQIGGTVVEQAALTYWVAESPADTAFMAQTDADAQTLFKAKFLSKFISVSK
jgi:phage terminase large subunit GpA-like protein